MSSSLVSELIGNEGGGLTW